MKYETEIDFNSRNTVTIFIDLIEDNSKVLEFGAASGRLTQYLTEKKSCKVSIVEIDEEAAEIAKQYAADYVIGDIMDYQWLDKFSESRFDYILFADVLEHLTRPEEVLDKVKRLMKDDGRVLISLPNIAYNGVLINLYKNNFKYRETGILDNTHLHFWTLDEARKMFCKLGYGVEVVDATYNQLKDSEFETDYRTLPCVLADIIKSRVYGEIYQLIFSLSRNEKIDTVEKIQGYTDYLYVQCFFGTGENWDACEDIKYPVSLNEYKFSKEICLPEGIKKFRLDPLNTQCIVRVNVVDQDGIRVSEYDTNGKRIGDVFCFAHGDSQIEYEVKPETEILKIEIEYMMYQEDSIYGWICDSIKEQRDVIEQKENYINEQREALEERDNQIREINVIVEQKENYINEQREMLKERDNQIRELNGIIIQKENYINEQRDMLKEKEERMNQFEAFVLKKGIKELYNLFLKANERE